MRVMSDSQRKAIFAAMQSAGKGIKRGATALKNSRTIRASKGKMKAIQHLTNKFKKQALRMRMSKGKHEKIGQYLRGSKARREADFATGRMKEDLAAFMKKSLHGYELSGTTARRK